MFDILGQLELFSDVCNRTNKNATQTTLNQKGNLLLKFNWSLTEVNSHNWSL